ncbi:TonB family protein [Gallaecimonas sp. GXIMD1310]|uniref:TonB family protein n=1 Tax=Gallaecimonas sp. GXIMD1310 TaxID=3131926 RepID=UPI003244203B
MRHVVMLAAALLSLPASATYNTALVAYQHQQYAKAFKDFQQTARLGQAQSQFNLALMYGKGQGTTADLIQSYAWLSVAADNGNARAAAIKGQLLNQLPPARMPAAAKAAYALKQRYGKKALQQTLLPVKGSADKTPRLKPPKAIKRVEPRYPMAAADRLQVGFVVMNFDINKAGQVENVLVINAEPAKVFNHAALTAIRQWRFTPPLDANGKPQRYDGKNMIFDFRMHGVRVDEQRIKASQDKLSKYAQQGNPVAQYRLAGMLEWKQNMHSKWRLNGAPDAAYQAPPLKQTRYAWRKPSVVVRPGKDQSPLMWRVVFSLNANGRPTNVALTRDSTTRWGDAIIRELKEYQFSPTATVPPGARYIAAITTDAAHDRISVGPAKHDYWPRIDKLVIQAAQGGIKEAQYQLGVKVLRGVYYQQDTKKAKRWLNLAAAQGFQPAKRLLTALHQAAKANRAP